MFFNNFYCEFYIKYTVVVIVYIEIYKVYIIYWISVGLLFLINVFIFEYGVNDEIIGVFFGL